LFEVRKQEKVGNLLSCLQGEVALQVVEAVEAGPCCPSYQEEEAVVAEVLLHQSLASVVEVVEEVHQQRNQALVEAEEAVLQRSQALEVVEEAAVQYWRILASAVAAEAARH